MGTLHPNIPTPELTAALNAAARMKRLGRPYLTPALLLLTFCVVLVGDPGVGRRSLVQGLALLMAEGKGPAGLRNLVTVTEHALLANAALPAAVAGRGRVTVQGGGSQQVDSGGVLASGAALGD